MEATASHLLLLQNYISSKQTTLKQKIMHCVQVMFQNILHLIFEKTGLKGIVKKIFC